MLVGEHILAERGAELGQTLDDLGEARFRRTVECGAGAAEGGVVAFEHPLLLGGQAERVGLPHQRIDAAEQRGVGAKLVPVARDLRRQLALDLEKRFVAVGADQKAKDLLDARREPGRSFRARRWCWRNPAAADWPATASISAWCSANARA